MDYSPPGSSVHGNFRQEYWDGLPFPIPGDLTNRGTKPTSPPLADRFSIIYCPIICFLYSVCYLEDLSLLIHMDLSHSPQALPSCPECKHSYMNEYGICFAITDNATTIILVAHAWVTCKNAFSRVENKKGNCRVIGTGTLSFNRYYQIALQWLYQILGSQTVYDTTSCSIHSFSSAQFSSLSHVWLFVTPWTAACQASLSITNSQSLLKLMSIELVMPSNHLNLCRPLPLPPLIFPSIRVFSNESVLRIKWPKYWSFKLQHQSFQRIFRTGFL